MSLQATIDELRRYLPIQFPLGVFIHNNMLMTFEDRTFDEGVNEAAQMFGARRTLPEAYYLEKWKAGRIGREEVDRELHRWIEREGLPSAVAGFKTSEVLWQLMLAPISIPHRVHTEDEDASFGHWVELTEKLPPFATQPKKRQAKRWKTYLLQEFGEDINGLFHSTLIRFLSAYLDQGMATWHNPDTQVGLLASFRAFIEANRSVSPQWMGHLHVELPTIPDDGIEEWLEGFVAQLPYVENTEQYLLHTMLELRGWAGMVNKFEREPHLVPRANPKIKLVDYVAIYLLLERSAYNATLEKLELSALPIPDRDEDREFMSPEQISYLVHEVALRLKLNPGHIQLGEAKDLVQLALNYNESARCLCWHRAFDLTVRNMCLDTIAACNPTLPASPTKSLEARIYFCIDDREESFRRYVEESNPNVETYGVVGFFGIDMQYKSANHPDPMTYCPPVVTPSRVIEEVVVGDPDRRLRDRFNLGRGNQSFYYGTRAEAGSFLFTLVTGPLTSFILLLRVFFPRLANRLLQRAQDLVVKPLPTKINFNAEDGGGGYQVPEMANVVATIMKFAGTVKSFPKLQFMIAHGATSSNNPYKNAYGCGACSGKAGIPNSQIFCGMANNPKVRDELRRTHGIDIPPETFFVACYHDTSTDEVLAFNVEEAPATHQADLERILGQIRSSAHKNSLERCRHFAAGRKLLDEKITFQHVQERGANLAEPRPEYGHTNNAMCVIGRRVITKGIYLDRRSFLTSYDPSTDPDGKILASVMAGAVPVAGGINLDYYFSRVDNEVYGSGTKLPLNVAGLLGVMTGGSSDLRIGLAFQMVELHEPVRITILIEARPDIVQGILNSAPRQKQLVHHRWLHMAVLNPEDGKIYLHDGTSFVPYEPRPIQLPVIKDLRAYVAHQAGVLPFGRLQPRGGAA